MSNITQRKDFKVIIFGGFLLAANAGFIASLSLAGLHSTTVAHVTGDVVRSSLYFAQGIVTNHTDDWFNFGRYTLVWLSYVLGAAISAMIVSGTKSFDLRRTYGWAMLLEAFFLWVSYMVSNRATARTGWWWSEYFAAIACGMQNALCTSYSSAIIRTTHMTGTCTDVGIAIGQEIRLQVILPLRKYLKSKFKYISVPEEQLSQDLQQAAGTTGEISILWRLLVLIPLMIGFLLGSFFGTLVYMRIKNKALLVPAVFVGIIGFIYVISTTIYMIYFKVKEIVYAPIIPLISIMKTNNAETQ